MIPTALAHDSGLASAISGPVIEHGGFGEPSREAGVRRTLSSDLDDADFRRDGFAVVGFVDAAMVERLLAISTEVGPAPGDDMSGYFPGNVSTSAEWKYRVIEAVRPLIEFRLSEVFADHHIFHLTFMTKWPGLAGKLQVHQDPTMVADEGRFRSVNLWCPLNVPADAADMGTLRVIRGSTDLPTASWYRVEGGHIPSGLEQVEESLYEDSVPVATQPGEAIVLDHRLIHCSPPNLSDVPRQVLAIGLRPAEAASVHLECDASGRVTWREVDDQYFIDHPAVDLSRYPPTRSFKRIPGPEIGLQHLASLPEASGTRTRQMPAPPLSETTVKSSRQLSCAWLGPDSQATEALGRRLSRDGFVRVSLLDDDAVEWAREAIVQPEANRLLASLLDPRLAEVLPGTVPVLNWSSTIAPRAIRACQTPHRQRSITDEPQGPRSYQVWIPLDPIIGHTGQLRVVRASHRTGPSLRGNGGNGLRPAPASLGASIRLRTCSCRGSSHPRCRSGEMVVSQLQRCIGRDDFLHCP